MIHRNKSGWSQADLIWFGLAALGDGLVRTLSLGFLYSDFTRNISRAATRRNLAHYHMNKEKP